MQGFFRPKQKLIQAKEVLTPIALHNEFFGHGCQDRLQYKRIFIGVAPMRFGYPRSEFIPPFRSIQKASYRP